MDNRLLEWVQRELEGRAVNGGTLVFQFMLSCSPPFFDLKFVFQPFIVICVRDVYHVRDGSDVYFLVLSMFA